MLDGVVELLSAGQEPTYARVAIAAGVPERTLYRYFPTREDLMAALVGWVNERAGVQRATTPDEAIEMVRRLFPALDEIAPVVKQILLAPEGLAARLADNHDRQAAALAVVDDAAAGLQPDTRRRLAAATQLLTSAATWQSLRDYWDMEGGEAAETVAVALSSMLAGARRPTPESGEPS